MNYTILRTYDMVHISKIDSIYINPWKNDKHFDIIGNDTCKPLNNVKTLENFLSIYIEKNIVFIIPHYKNFIVSSYMTLIIIDDLVNNYYINNNIVLNHSHQLIDYINNTININEFNKILEEFKHKSVIKLHISKEDINKLKSTTWYIESVNFTDNTSQNKCFEEHYK